MKKIITSVILTLFLFNMGISQIRIVVADPVADSITIQNFGGSMIDISSYWFCALFSYNQLNALTVQTGSLNLGPGLRVTLTGFSLNNTISDLGLYSSPSFGSSLAMVDFTQWGSGGNGRESVASAKGIWTSGTFISGTGPFYYIGDGSHNESTAWSLTPPCTSSDIPTLTSSPTVVCDGNMATINIAGNLNGASEWKIYMDSCGGTLVNSTSSSSVMVTPSFPSTQYFVRGEGSCFLPGNCADITITLTPLPTVSFSALTDLCIDAGIQMNVAGGSPTGGIYSGPGVTDNGNGMNFNFDPTAAGIGVHGLTYTYTDGSGCINSVVDSIEVFALPTVAYSAPAGFCLNAGLQPNVGGGSPMGGIYSGIGTTDNSNGQDFIFDPQLAGVGKHAITYSYSDINGCSSSAIDSIEVFALPVLSFVAPPDICLNENVQTHSGGSPTGGIHSGPGITDNGNGLDFDFDPGTAGVGVHGITYTYTDLNNCTNSIVDSIEVFDVPVVSFTAPADLCIDAGLQTGLGGGMPCIASGSMYSGTGVTDDGNGTTYSFDPGTAGAGVHTITYSFTDSNHCTSSVGDDIEVFALPIVSFIANDLCIDAGVQINVIGGSPVGGSYNGIGVTDNGNGMNFDFDPSIAGVGTHNISYMFTDTNNCSSMANDSIRIFSLPTVSFVTLNDLCSMDVLIGLGGGTPTGTGGVYSGNGVTDDGNGTTYSFNSSVTGPGLQIITYTFTDSNNCTSSSSDSLEVYTLPSVSLSTLSNLCFDDAVQMSLSGGLPSGMGGIYSGNGVTDGGDGLSYSFDPMTSGAGVHVISYTFTDANNCSNTEYDSLLVTAIDTSITSVSPMLTVSTQGASYQWIDCNSMNYIQNDTNQAFTATVDGAYAVEITLNGCIDTSQCYNITVTDIEEINALALKPFLNPISDYLTFELMNYKDNVYFSISSLEGKIMHQNKINEGQVKVDVSDWAQGVYLLHINDNTKHQTLRFVKN